MAEPEGDEAAKPLATAESGQWLGFRVRATYILDLEDEEAPRPVRHPGDRQENLALGSLFHGSFRCGVSFCGLSFICVTWPRRAVLWRTSRSYI